MKVAHKMVVVATFAVVATVLAACSSGSSSSSSTDTGTDGSAPPAEITTAPPPAGDAVTVSGHEFMFDPTTVTIASGGTVTFTNTGTIEHNFTVKEDDSIVASAAAGASASVTVDLEPGTYTFVCSVPGHEQAGMTGTLTVT